MTGQEGRTTAPGGPRDPDYDSRRPSRELLLRTERPGGVARKFAVAPENAGLQLPSAPAVSPGNVP